YRDARLIRSRSDATQHAASVLGCAMQEDEQRHLAFNRSGRHLDDAVAAVAAKAQRPACERRRGVVSWPCRQAAVTFRFRRRRLRRDKARVTERDRYQRASGSHAEVAARNGTIGETRHDAASYYRLRGDGVIK